LVCVAERLTREGRTAHILRSPNAAVADEEAEIEVAYVFETRSAVIFLGYCYWNL
jgi:hypothetical protein